MILVDLWLVLPIAILNSLLLLKQEQNGQRMFEALKQWIGRNIPTVKFLWTAGQDEEKKLLNILRQRARAGVRKLYGTVEPLNNSKIK
jgi:hypothetical protein